jgi:hypothetical protein
MNTSLKLSSVAAMTMFAWTIAPAFAQDKQADAAQPVAVSHEPQWSDAEAKAVGAMLAGSWKSTSAITATGTDKGVDVVLGIAPVYVSGMNNAMYVEMARADGLNRPYRHLIWHLSKMKDGWHLQSFEFRRTGGMLASAVGLWAEPSAFPPVAMDDLAATMDIPLKSEGGKLMGTTPVGYATSAGGAVEMTSSVSLSADAIEFADRGFDASGKQVWGPAPNQTYAFAKADVGIKATKSDRGLVVINYPSKLSGQPAKNGDLVTVNYAGYLENGTVFDSSYERSQPFQYAQGTKLIEGWTTAMADAQVGMKRRLVIPAALAYGERGSRGKVPPMATLIFDLEVTNVEVPPPPSVTEPISTPTVITTPGGTKLNKAEPPAEIKEKMEADMRRRMEERAKKEAQKPAQPAPAAPK